MEDKKHPSELMGKAACQGDQQPDAFKTLRTKAENLGFSDREMKDLEARYGMNFDREMR